MQTNMMQVSRCSADAHNFGSVSSTLTPANYTETALNKEPSSMYLQLSHQTRMNRFPKIFSRVKELYPNPKRILSFGCSTGEECFTLAEQFPESEIVGVDIDFCSIYYARRTNTCNRILFQRSLDGTGKFDVITCLMVLFSMETAIPFRYFKETLLQLDERLNPGGLLTLYTTQFRFRKLALAKNYEVIRAWRRIHPVDKKVYYSGYFRKKQDEPCQTS